MSDTRRATTGVWFHQRRRRLCMERDGTIRPTLEAIGMDIPTPTVWVLPPHGVRVPVGVSRLELDIRTAMAIRITTIRGGGHGDITERMEPAVGVRRGATDGEDTRAPTSTGVGETLRMHALGQLGRIRIRAIMERRVEPPSRIRSAARLGWQAEVRIPTSIREIQREDVGLSPTIPKPVSWLGLEQDTQEISIADRELPAAEDLPTTRTAVPVLPLE